MAKKTMSAREKAREKLLIGILLFILPSGIRALGLQLGAFGLFIDVLGLIGVVLLIIGIVGVAKTPRAK